MLYKTYDQHIRDRREQSVFACSKWPRLPEFALFEMELLWHLIRQMLSQGIHGLVRFRVVGMVVNATNRLQILSSFIRLFDSVFVITLPLDAIIARLLY